MAAFTQAVLNHLDGIEPLAARKDTGYTIDYDKVRAILLRDGRWHYVYRPTEKDRAELTKTMNWFRTTSNQLAKGKSDEEIAYEYPQVFPGRQHPARLGAKPFRVVLVDGERWGVWPEAQDPIPGLSEIMAPWSQILALEIA